MRRRRIRNVSVDSHSALESLENRVLPTVTAVFHPGSGRLVLKGDNAGDSVSVEGTGIAGSMNVYVNGILSSTFSGVQSIVAKLKGGDDTLNLSAVGLSGDVRAKMGIGDDTVDLDNTVDVGIAPPTDLNIGGDLIVKMGFGSDDFIDMATNGVNSISVNGNTNLVGVADVEMAGSGGSSAVEIGDINFAGKLRMAIASQGDVNGDSINVDINDINVGGIATVIASADDDVIQIGDSHFGSAVTVLLGFGDNLIDLDVDSDANDFDGEVTLSGVLGDDTYDASDANAFASPPNLIAIESVI